MLLVLERDIIVKRFRKGYNMKTHAASYATIV